MLPRTNIQNVVLRKDVSDAIAAGTFHVWGVSTVEEGIELLTGVPAGVRNEDGTYPEGTVFRKVADRLDAFFNSLSGSTGMRVETRIVSPPPEPAHPPRPACRPRRHRSPRSAWSGCSDLHPTSRGVTAARHPRS